MEERAKAIMSEIKPFRDYEEGISYLRSLHSLNEITEEEYDYVVEHWDELL